MIIFLNVKDFIWILKKLNNQKNKYIIIWTSNGKKNCYLILETSKMSLPSARLLEDKVILVCIFNNLILLLTTSLAFLHVDECWPNQNKQVRYLQVKLGVILYIKVIHDTGGSFDLISGLRVREVTRGQPWDLPGRLSQLRAAFHAPRRPELDHLLCLSQSGKLCGCRVKGLVRECGC